MRLVEENTVSWASVKSTRKAREIGAESKPVDLADDALRGQDADDEHDAVDGVPAHIRPEPQY